jgi:D-alanyl-D-alanine carboxypeptidase
METLKKDLKNTNGLLSNMPEVNGLKTGTTDRSGACLITSLTVTGAEGPHDLIVVVLGAENSQTRIQTSELMARYAKNVIEGDAAKISYSINDKADGEAEQITSESIVRAVVEYALKKK